MPVRLVLPRDVAGVNAFRLPVPEAPAPSEPADLVVLVVPSPARVLQAGWLDALRRRSWSRFAAWLREALADTDADWRYDRLATRWAGSVGADRVHVVAGEDPAAVGDVLAGLCGADAVAPQGWNRVLTGGEVTAVEALVGELEQLGLAGRNAADMVDGSVAALVRTPAGPGADPATDGVPPGLRRRVAEEADRLLAAIDASGVHLHGDRSALQWTAASPGPPAVAAESRVGLDAAVALSVGALERVATWASPEATT